MTVATVGNAGNGNAAELFRSSTAHSPSIFALERAGGGTGKSVDFGIPCNPYFPTPAMFDQLGSRLRDILTYYPSSADTIITELCSTLGLNPQTVAMGNGSTELITWIDHLLIRESMATPIPTFGRWTDQPMETGKRVDMFLLPEANGFGLDPAAFVSFVRARGSRTAVICNPNNPDGGYLHKHQVVQMMDALADLDLVVIDESFLDFVDAEANPSVVHEAAVRPNVIVLKSLGKNFGLHGVRFGYLVANPALAGKIRKAVPKWNLNSFAEVVVFMLKEYRQEYAESLRKLSRDRQEMSWQLAALPGVTVYPSQGNFIFIKLPDGVDGRVLRDRLFAEHGVVIRECGNKLGSSSSFVRLVVRSQADVQQLLVALSNVLYGGSWYAAPQSGGEWQVQQAQPQQVQQAQQQAAPVQQQPAAPVPQLMPAQPPVESFVMPQAPQPQAPQPASAAALMPVEAYPQQQRESYPMQQQREAYPAQQQREAYSVQPQREAYPAQQQQREAYPAQQQREAYPAQQQRDLYAAQQPTPTTLIPAVPAADLYAAAPAPQQQPLYSAPSQSQTQVQPQPSPDWYAAPAQLAPDRYASAPPQPPTTEWNGTPLPTMSGVLAPAKRG